VDDTGRFRNAVSSNLPGTRIKLKILRDGKAIDLTAKIGSLEDAEGGVSQKSSDLLGKLGFSVGDITPEIAQRFGYEYRTGAVVGEVQEGSPAARKGLQPYDLIVSVERSPISSAQDLHAALKLVAEQGKNVVLMRVGRERTMRYVAIPVPKDE
jgi:serine protease Do